MNNYSAHDLQVNERLGRIEEKLDGFSVRLACIADKLDRISEHEQRLTKLETERDTRLKIVTPIVTVVAGVIGGIASKFIGELWGGR